MLFMCVILPVYALSVRHSSCMLFLYATLLCMHCLYVSLLVCSLCTSLCVYAPSVPHSSCMYVALPVCIFCTSLFLYALSVRHSACVCTVCTSLFLYALYVYVSLCVYAPYVRHSASMHSLYVTLSAVTGKYSCMRPHT
jgi:hypothetical protein